MRAHFHYCYCWCSPFLSVFIDLDELLAYFCLTFLQSSSSSSSSPSLHFIGLNYIIYYLLIHLNIYLCRHWFLIGFIYLPLEVVVVFVSSTFYINAMENNYKLFLDPAFFFVWTHVWALCSIRMYIFCLHHFRNII